MPETSLPAFPPALPRAILDTLFDTELRIRRANATHIGFPYNLQPALRVPSTLSSYLINNLGDPYTGSRFAAEVCDLEDQVIAWLSQVWHGADPELYAGSIGASGTEGNIWAIHLGREALRDAVLLHSADAHYSIPRAGQLLRIETREVGSTPAGEIDLGDLDRVLGALQGRPVILSLTCGTPMKGAHDDIAGALRVLDVAGYGSDRRFVHLDAALSGMVLPFLTATTPNLVPDFRLGVDSISISGHKMIGTPMPCGALVCRSVHLERFSETPVHLRLSDTTLLGSRNGHAVLSLWTRLMEQGVAGFARDALRCTLRAKDLAGSLRRVGVDVLLNAWSMTVVFPEPSEAIVKTYQLACHMGLARAIIMPSVTDSLIERFIEDYCSWFRQSARPD
jgi:histidine decarboxylase